MRGPVIDDIWKQFLDIIREEAGNRVVETWFKAVTLQSWDVTQQVVYLATPNSFIKNWLCNHYLFLFQTHLGRLLNMHMPRVIFTDLCKDNLDSVNDDTKKVKGALVVPFDDAIAVEKKAIPLIKEAAKKVSTEINLAYQFDTFVVGPHNALAYAAAHAITKKLGTLYNPLCIHGGPGLGKTHLLHAIGNDLKVNNRSLCVVYQQAERFIDEFVTSIRSNKVQQFQKKYQSADVLLIDDIQLMSRKEQTQDIFFSIFNVLYDAQRQIVFTSDTLPQHIGGLGNRLKSRLAWGLIADISCPTLETKVSILKKKAQINNKILPDDVALYIASCSFETVRELESALVRIMALSSLTNQMISLDFARTILSQNGAKRSNAVSIQSLTKAISKTFSCSFSQIQSKSRLKEVSMARHIMMYFMKKYMGKSLREIGLLLGSRNHSTVLHAITKIEEQIEQDSEFFNQIKSIENEIIQG